MIDSEKYYVEVRKPLENIRNYSYAWHLRNNVSIFFRQSFERSLIKALNENNIHLDDKKILDVGCGKGGTLRHFVDLGANPTSCYGIDISDYRIQEAKRQNPLINYQTMSSEQIAYPDSFFDIVLQFTAFSSMGSEDIREKTAQEIGRVLSQHGYIIWYDISRAKKSSQFPLPISATAIKSYFPNYQFIAHEKLHARLAGALAKKSYFLALLIDKLLPFQKTNILCIMKK
ncbi:MAG TPA: hypothetical protein DDX47_00570 [Candidatus Jacksonbacteria bacterium]|nr:MAG: hypothetical protein UW45_C0019G0003 [Parcubacteria group bacterium GW2011_GWC2_44_22]OGY74641.1 MAG: hypothetical protein A2240_05990 [Candidatus Jacksonbacteria bacterium RIFOXYA2_FULL_43_12]OGY75344.1 MAG: hypothetical protein A2295_04155 [Candidatus Jacksonbacteria bacterium RIFOXYB2_FULL_44_15]OGY82046.1 MAG: hypothetical protein A2550_00550 [Candidatus Jacksonbacteria bacterium RIFOXYD2_FULL_43_21]HBH45849.1 hypothetical protein [Candidatus Jacksonbacteria bacterium]